MVGFTGAERSQIDVLLAISSDHRITLLQTWGKWGLLLLSQIVLCLIAVARCKSAAVTLFPELQDSLARQNLQPSAVLAGTAQLPAGVAG